MLRDGVLSEKGRRSPSRRHLDFLAHGRRSDGYRGSLKNERLLIQVRRGSERSSTNDYPIEPEFPGALETLGFRSSLSPLSFVSLSGSEKMRCWGACLLTQVVTSKPAASVTSRLHPIIQFPCYGMITRQNMDAPNCPHITLGAVPQRAQCPYWRPSLFQLPSFCSPLRKPPLP